jgi:flagellar hook protein FlgE
MGIQSFFSGVSGLEAHSTWLDVIGNNVSNANTVAYKSSRLKFADQLSATLSESQGKAVPSAASMTAGGNGNPSFLDRDALQPRGDASNRSEPRLGHPG